MMDWGVIHQLQQTDENAVIAVTRKGEIMQLRYSNVLLLKDSGTKG